MGYGVNDGEEYPAIVSRSLDRAFGQGEIPVVNNALSGSGNGRWLKFLQREGSRYNPRLVALQVMGNDFQDNVRESYFQVSIDGTLVELDIEIPAARVIQSMVESIPGLSYSYLVGMLKQRRESQEEIQKISEGKSIFGDQLTYRLLEEVLQFCNDAQYPVLAILVGLSDNQLQKVQAIFRSHDAQTIVIPDRHERPDLYYVVDGHWNPNGHEFVADIFFKELVSNDRLNP